MHFEILFVTLFALATAVALLARWVKVPYTVALVAAGLVLGAVHAFDPPNLTKELLFAIFLPGLLFEAAFHLEIRKFWQNKLAINALAMPGVVAAIGLTAALLTPAANALHFVEGFEFKHGLVFASLIAATDPIAVVALFKSLGAPKRLTVLVEGESLLNDGTSVVLFTLILGVVAGGRLSISGAVWDFVRVVGMGMAIGTALGYGCAKLSSYVDDPMIEITLTSIAAYGSFVAAEQFHYSGVIATVAAGMLYGHFAGSSMSPSTRIAVESFWEYVAFALNSMVFLLIGFQVRLDALLASYKAILTAFVAMTVGRALIVYLVTALLRRTAETIPWRWSAVLTWGGLRGGLSMVLALALPADFPHRELIVTMTFGIVVLSILVQGLTMAPLLKKLGVICSQEDRQAYEIERGVVRAATAALGELERMARQGAVPGDVAATLRADYQRRLEQAEAKIRELHSQAVSIREEEQHRARRHLLMSEKEALQTAFREGYIGQEAFERLAQDVDSRLVRLESGEPIDPGLDSSDSPTVSTPSPGHG